MYCFFGKLCLFNLRSSHCLLGAFFFNPFASRRRNHTNRDRRLRAAPQRIPASTQVRSHPAVRLSLPVRQPYRSGVQPALPLAPFDARQLLNKWGRAVIRTVSLQHVCSDALRRGGPRGFLLQANCWAGSKRHMLCNCNTQLWCIFTS